MRILLLTTTSGYQARSFAEAALALGIDVVFGSDRCHVLDDPWQDRAIAMRFENPMYSLHRLREAGEARLDGIVAVGDKPTVAAAVMARELGLPWHSEQAATACHIKFRARELYAQAALNVPRFTVYNVQEGADAAFEELCRHQRARFPVVLKPVSLSGSRGVIRANDGEEFLAAFRRISALLLSRELQVHREPASNQILVEEYIPGAEFAVEALMIRGRLRVLALFDKPDPLEGPFFEETIYVTPSRAPERDRAAIVDVLERAAAALGLYHGPVHAEFRVNERGAWPLDIAARPIGGLCARALRFQDGMSLEELVIRNAVGEDVSAVERETRASAVMMIPVPEPGVFEGIEGEADALAVPGIEEVHITAKVGQKLLRWPEASSYPGFLFARAATSAEAEAAVREAHRRLTFLIAPALPVV